MNTYVALLRGINVSGKNAIRMAELQKTFERLGFGGVRTYLQSGNVVFQAPQVDEANLASAIEGGIKKDFGLEVPVLGLSATDLDRIARSNPLWPEAGGEETHFHATFLFQPVSSKTFGALRLPVTGDERAILVENVVLLHCPHGYGRTKLNNSYFERALGVPATTRNWRTVQALRDLCGDP